MLAGAVVLATGGYGADPELFAELEGAPLVSAAARTSTGDGLHLGLAVGAALQGAGTYLPTFGGLPDPVSPGRANWHDRQRLTSERPPWEIYVDRSGRRWVAEDEPSIDEKERALTGVPDQTFWTVFDDAALEACHRQPPDRGGQGARPRCARWPTPGRGCTPRRDLRELADLAGIDPDGLCSHGARLQRGSRRGEGPRARSHAPAGADRAAARSTPCATTPSPWSPSRASTSTPTVRCATAPAR